MTVELPFWVYSPSPMTLAFWVGCSVYGTVKQKPSHWREWLRAFGISAFLLGLVVLPFDAFWCIAQFLKFRSLYPVEAGNLVYPFLRDVAGIVLCWIEVGAGFGKRGRFDKTLFVDWTGILIIFFIAWFINAPSPVWTDWTFAYRVGEDRMVVLASFFISHVIGKSLQGLAYYFLWNTPRESRNSIS